MSTAIRGANRLNLRLAPFTSSKKIPMSIALTPIWWCVGNSNPDWWESVPIIGRDSDSVSSRAARDLQRVHSGGSWPPRFNDSFLLGECVSRCASLDNRKGMAVRMFKVGAGASQVKCCNLHSTTHYWVVVKSALCIHYTVNPLNHRHWQVFTAYSSNCLNIVLCYTPRLADCDELLAHGP